MSQDAATLIEIHDLVVEFAETRRIMGARGATVKAVNHVSLDIRRGETLGLVGESGSGKTTLGKATIRLIEPTAGLVRYNGVDLAQFSAGELRRQRTRMQIVFQDPNSSLNPRMKALDIVGDGLLIHGMSSKRELVDRVAAVLERVGLRRDDLDKYPHQFSGGQRQRLGIARALILGPEFLVLDEPVSALDVSIQAQIINLLKDLKEEHKLTYLFVAHDIGVVANVSDRIAVMYLGKIMEEGSDIIANPRHPYTKALLQSVPVPDPEKRSVKAPLAGDPPNPSNPPSGCVFRTRCPLAQPRCAETVPELKNGVACLLIQ